MSNPVAKPTTSHHLSPRVSEGMSLNWLLLGRGSERLDVERGHAAVESDLREVVRAELCAGARPGVARLIDRDLPSGAELLKCLIEGRANVCRRAITKAQNGN